MAKSPHIVDNLNKILLDDHIKSIKLYVAEATGDQRVRQNQVKDFRDVWPYLLDGGKLEDFDYLLQLFTNIGHYPARDFVQTEKQKHLAVSGQAPSTDGACLSTAAGTSPVVGSSKKDKSGSPTGQPADPKRVYELNPPDKAQGLCVIFNNKTFKDNADRPQHPQPWSLIREGTDNDEKELTRVFESFSLKVKPHADLTSDEMRTRIEYYGLKDHSKYKMFIVCFLSHGEANHVYGVDWQRLSIADVLQLFSKDSCKSLDRKPKLFLVQTCQGQQRMDVTDGASSTAEARYNIEDRDMFLFYATLPDFAAHRNINTGGWFIQILCENLDRDGEQHYFHEIVQRVKTDVSQRSTSDNKGQHAFDINGLTKMLKFKRK